MITGSLGRRQFSCILVQSVTIARQWGQTEGSPHRNPKGEPALRRTVLHSTVVEGSMLLTWERSSGSAGPGRSKRVKGEGFLSPKKKYS